MASPMNYDGGLTITFQSGDLNRSIPFYQDILGFKLLYRVDEIGWCELQTEVAGGRVNVGLSQVEKPKAGAGAVPTFGVKDIAKSRALTGSLPRQAASTATACAGVSVLCSRRFGLGAGRPAAGDCSFITNLKNERIAFTARLIAASPQVFRRSAKNFNRSLSV